MTSKTIKDIEGNLFHLRDNQAPKHVKGIAVRLDRLDFVGVIYLNFKIAVVVDAEDFRRLFLATGGQHGD